MTNLSDEREAVISDAASCAMNYLGNTATEEQVKNFVAGFLSGSEYRLARADADGWMPIESAPKDGSFVLVYADGFSIHEGSWCEHHEAFCDCEGYTMWWATHWRQVPAPPKEDGE